MKPGVYRNVVVPLARNVKRLDDVHGFLKLRIHLPFCRHEPAVAAAVKLLARHCRRNRLDFLGVEVGIVRPFHKDMPHVVVAAVVEVDAVVHERYALERRHGPVNIALAVDDAHSALLVHVLGRLLVEPHEVETRALKLLPAHFRALKADSAYAAEHVSHRYVVDYSAVWVAALARHHHHVRYPLGVKVVQHLALSDLALNLARWRHHPAADVRAVFAVRVNAARSPHRFHRAALGLARAVAAEHPAVALLTLVKLELL